MAYKMTVTLATPEVLDDEDFSWPLDLADKKSLHRVETAFIKGLNALNKLTADEVESGKKPFVGTDPQLVVFTVDIARDDGTDFGGYTFRWPGQTKEARVYLAGMIDGLMHEVGHGNAKQRKPKK